MVGPDLLGVAGATAFLFAVISLFALVDRLRCGAWEALNGSPAWGLVEGMSAWAREVPRARRVSSPADPPVRWGKPGPRRDRTISYDWDVLTDTERVPVPGLPRVGRGRSRFAVACAA